MRLLLLSAVLGLVLCTAPLKAEPLPSGPAALQTDPEAPYLDVIRSIEESSDIDLSLNLVAEAMAEQFAIASPELALGEKRYPGLGRAMAEALKPLLKTRDMRLRKLFLPRQVAAIRANLTVAEAADVAWFYRSKYGRKLLGNVIAGFDGKQMMVDAVNGGDVGAAAFKADSNRAVARAIVALTEEDLIEIGKLATERPALQKLKPLGAALGEVRLAAENEPMTAEEEAEMTAVVVAAIEQHIARAEAAK